MKKNFTTLDTIRLIIKNKKLFIIIGSAVGVISLIVSLLLPVYYKSTCILYPFNPEAYDPRNVNKATNPYGSSTDGDRIMAIAESRDVQYYIIKKYNMIERYDIDTTDLMADIKVREEFIGNLKVIENEFSAIEISFLDQDPDTAAIIVNDIVSKIDDLNKKPLVDISQKIFESYEKLIEEKYAGIDSIQKLVDILDFKNDFTRSELISIELLHTITELKTARKSLEIIKNDFSTLNIIQHAEPIAKKAYPKKAFIIITCIAISLFLTFLVVVIKELYRLTVKNEEVEEVANV